MAEAFLHLGVDDRREVLNVAADRSGRPTHLLEKDVWVVWSRRPNDGVDLDSVSAATFAVGATLRCEATEVAWVLGLAGGGPRWVNVSANPAPPSSAFEVGVRALQADDDSVYLAAASALQTG